MEDSDEEDSIAFGNPLPDEEELARQSRNPGRAFGQAITPSGTGSGSSVPAWKQEATDSEGRRRFHGAFTGGFSAGYYNTVGSKEGWAPKAFVSSRNKRAEKQAASARDYMDEDELRDAEEREGGPVVARSDFDTFGFTAQEVARRASQGPRSQVDGMEGALAQLVAPVNDSVGIRLLKKMGWRQGRGIGMKEVSVVDGSQAGHENEDQENIALLATHSVTRIYKPPELQGRKGLGYTSTLREHNKNLDTGQNETHDARALVEGGKEVVPSLFRPNAGRVGKGFGVGVMDGVDDDDVDVYDAPLSGFGGSRGSVLSGLLAKEVVDEEEDARGSLSSRIAQPLRLSQGREPTLMIGQKRTTGAPLPGFVKGKEPVGAGSQAAQGSTKWFKGPTVPRDFQCRHVFASDLREMRKAEALASSLAGAAAAVASASAAPPATARPPDDEGSRKAIDTLAAFVAKNGRAFEALARDRQGKDPKFAFLFGGRGANYYEWKVSILQAKQAIESRQNEAKAAAGAVDAALSGTSRLDAERRAQLLGEEQLQASAGGGIAAADKTRLQMQLQSNFRSGGSIQQVEHAPDTEIQQVRPFEADPEKQQRYERWLTYKVRGGLQPRGPPHMSLDDHAQEMEEFERTASALGQGHHTGSKSKPQVLDRQVLGAPKTTVVDAMSSRFAAASEEHQLVGEEAAKAGMFGRLTRVTEKWWPSALLCKRWGVPQPHKGEVPPDKRTSKINSLDLLGDLSEKRDTGLGLATDGHGPAVSYLSLDQAEAPKHVVDKPRSSESAPQSTNESRSERFLRETLESLGKKQKESGSKATSAPAPTETREPYTASKESDAVAPKIVGDQHGVGLESGEELRDQHEDELAVKPEDKPIDLFKAIFEADAEEEEEEDEEQEEAADAIGPNAQHDSAKAAGSSGNLGDLGTTIPALPHTTGAHENPASVDGNGEDVSEAARARKLVEEARKLLMEHSARRKKRKRKEKDSKSSRRRSDHNSKKKRKKDGKDEKARRKEERKAGKKSRRGESSPASSDHDPSDPPGNRAGHSDGYSTPSEEVFQAVKEDVPR